MKSSNSPGCAIALFFSYLVPGILITIGLNVFVPMNAFVSFICIFVFSMAFAVSWHFFSRQFFGDDVSMTNLIMFLGMGFMFIVMLFNENHTPGLISAFLESTKNETTLQYDNKLGPAVVGLVLLGVIIYELYVLVYQKDKEEE